MTVTPYLAGADAALNRLGLTKIAGVRDALRTALTGRVPLRHGTSAGRAAAIRSKGLLPDAAPGVSGAVSQQLADAQQGLAFTTRAPNTAKTYARQQQGLEAFEADPVGHTERLRGQAGKRIALLEKGLGYLPDGPLRKGLEDGIAPVKDALGGTDIAPLAVARHIAPKKPAPNSIVEMRVPREYVAANEAPSVEGRKMFDDMWAGAADKIQAKVPGLPAAAAAELGALPAAGAFSHDIIMRGGVPSKYIKGSPDYQGVSFDELRQHFAAARKDPRGLLKDVARSYTEVSHRPTKILGLDAPPPAPKESMDDLLARMFGPDATGPRPPVDAPVVPMAPYGTVPYGWRPGQ